MHALDARRTALLGAVFTVLILAAGPAAAQDQQGFPAITVTPGSLDFGTLEQNSSRVLEVEIANVGGALLIIDDVESTCGCTVAEPETRELAPGTSTRLVVTFDSKTFNGDQNKLVRIHSNDPAEPIVEVPVSAFVRAPLVFAPGNKLVGFGQVRARDARPATLRVSSPDGIPLQIEPVRLNEKLIEATIVTDKNGDPSNKVITMRLADGAPPGHIREIVTFSSNIPEMPTFDVEVSGNILADVVLEPGRINFRYLRRGQTKQQTFQLQMPRDLDLTIRETSLDLPGFEVISVTRNDHTGHYDIVVEGAPVDTADERVVAAKGRMKGVLRIVTSDPKLPIFEADIMYMLRI